jgi:dolichol-phosphate mannosyltransferase
MNPSDSIALSVVLPARDEAPNVGPLLGDIAAALAGIPHEIVLVDDGSGDGTAEAALALRPGLPQVRVLRHEKSCGQSAALRTGILAARGRVIATLDADGQNPAAELPRLAAPLLAPDADPRIGLVQGQRLRRQDTWSRRLASRLANAVRQMLLRDGVRDSGCGLKAFRRDVYLALPFFDHIHRFMPALIRREGYEVLLLDVSHADRRAGRSKYSNLGRALVGIVDLAGVAWLLRRRKLAQVRELG